MHFHTAFIIQENTNQTQRRQTNTIKQTDERKATMLNTTAVEYQDLVRCLVEQRLQVSKTEQQISAYRLHINYWITSEAESALEFLTTYPQPGVSAYWQVPKPKKQILASVSRTGIVKPDDVVRRTYFKVHLCITDRLWSSNRISTVSVGHLGGSEPAMFLHRLSIRDNDFTSTLYGLDFLYLCGFFQIVRAFMLQQPIFPWEIVDLICDYLPPLSCGFVDLNDQKLHEHLSQVQQQPGRS